MSSRLKSTCCNDALIRKSRFGCVTENPPRRGTSHLLAKLGDTVTVRTEGRVGRIRSSAVLNRSSASLTSGRYFWPASVSLKSARVAHEQLQAKAGLQHVHLVADRALRLIEFFGR